MDLELYIERIELYETGAMSAAERAAFEAELDSSSELRQSLALFRQANEVIEQRIENGLREQFRQWNDAAAQAPLTVTKPAGMRVVSMRTSWIRLAVAASVALLVGWFGVRWAGSQYSDQVLFTGQYEKPADSAFRSGTAAERPLQPGFEAWLAGDLEKAATFFNTIPPNDEYYAEAQYYLGHTALQQRQFDTAITAFGSSAERSASKFREKAEWNRVLTYLAAGRSEESNFQAFLVQIANDPAHSYGPQARVLQKKLDSIWR